MGSYLVFSAYQFQLCGLSVMCFPNLIISDPDFHLHVGGLLNPIPGKLFSILPVFAFDPFWRAPPRVEAYRRISPHLTWMLNTQTYLDERTGCTWSERMFIDKFKHIKEFTHWSCCLLPVFLPLFLLVLSSNPLCSLQIHFKSFAF